MRCEALVTPLEAFKSKPRGEDATSVIIAVRYAMPSGCGLIAAALCVAALDVEEGSM